MRRIFKSGSPRYTNSVVNWDRCKAAIWLMCAERIPFRRLDLGQRLNFATGTARVWRNAGTAWSAHRSPGPGWCWSSPQRAGSSAIQGAEAGRGAAWRAPSATPSPGRSERQRRGGHDSVNAKPITLQSWIQLPNLDRLDGRTKYVMDLTTILNLMKSSTDCKASEIYSRWQ